MAKKIIKNSLIFILVTIVMIVICLYLVMWICVNGPSKRAKELFVMSVRETSAIGFLANLYCSNEEIEAIENASKQTEVLEVNTSMITISNKSETDNGDNDTTNNSQSANNEYGNGDRDINSDINSDTKEEDIEIINISGSTYKGYLMIVKDPSRVFVGTSAPAYSPDIPGKRVIDMIESYNATAGTNAGGFEDPKGMGNGGIPKGIVISEGTLRYGSESGTYEVIGITNDNILVVGKMTGKQALEMGIRDAVSFGPVLVINGEVTEASKGGGLNPRTAIGQRSDGAILILVIDGRQSSSLGASYADLAEIMIDNGAVNAANLDGGSSSVLYYQGELLNSCSSLYGPRTMPTSIIVR